MLALDFLRKASNEPHTGKCSIKHVKFNNLILTSKIVQCSRIIAPAFTLIIYYYLMSWLTIIELHNNR